MLGLAHLKYLGKVSKPRLVRGVSSYYKLFPKTLPNGPPPAGKFDIDLKQLRTEYIQAQRGAHPDVSSNNNEGITSAEISNAYRVLCNPLTRAEHILALNGQNPLEEGASIDDEDLLMEIMMARERVNDAERLEDLDPIRLDNSKMFSESESRVADSLDRGDFNTAKAALVQLSYLSKVKDAIEKKSEEIEKA